MKKKKINTTKTNLKIPACVCRSASENYVNKPLILVKGGTDNQPPQPHSETPRELAVGGEWWYACHSFQTEHKCCMFVLPSSQLIISGIAKKADLSDLESLLLQSALTKQSMTDYLCIVQPDRVLKFLKAELENWCNKSYAILIMQHLKQLTRFIYV